MCIAAKVDCLDCQTLLLESVKISSKTTDRSAALNRRHRRGCRRRRRRRCGRRLARRCHFWIVLQKQGSLVMEFVQMERVKLESFHMSFALAAFSTEAINGLSFGLGSTVKVKKSLSGGHQRREGHLVRVRDSWRCRHRRHLRRLPDRVLLSQGGHRRLAGLEGGCVLGLNGHVKQHFVGAEVFLQRLEVEKTRMIIFQRGSISP